MKQRIKGSNFFVGDIVRTGIGAVMDANKVYRVISISEAERRGLDGYSLRLCRDNGWIPLLSLEAQTQYSDVECYSKRMINHV